MTKSVLKLFFIQIFICAVSYSGYSQVIDKDTVKIRRDSTIVRNVRDTSSLHNELNAVDSLKEGSLKFPVFSTAKDSIVEDFSGKEAIIHYYGNVDVKYDNLNITADYMAYNIDTKTLFASGIPDSTGNLVGNPIMKEGESTYTMEQLFYNFDTKKSRIKNMITQESEGFLHGDNLKMMPDKTINIQGGKYTTCNMEHPHFYIKMTKAKVEQEPSPATYFGPAYLVLEDVPLPFIIPFGFVPKQSDRSGGLLMPSFDEETARGFALKGLGYYFVFGDHFDATVTGDIFSLGSWNVMVTSRYRKRYKFNGELAANYSHNQTGERGGADFFESSDFSLRWSHSQDPKAHPGTTFSASVNFSTPMNNRFNGTTMQNRLQNQVSSSISYSKVFAGTPFSISGNVMHSQSSLDSSYAFTLPNVTLTMNRIYPFKKKEAAGKEEFYETISFSYNTTFENKVNFKAKEFGQPDFMKRFRSGMRHNFDIGLPTFTILKYLQFSPGVSYNMNWFFQKNSPEYNKDTDRVEDNISSAFQYFGTTHDFSASLSMNTRIYGLFNFGKNSKLQAIRHMVSPSISFSYRPELGTSWNGYKTMEYVDAKGVHQLFEYNQYNGLLYSPPSKGRIASMSFSLGNNLEAKLKDDSDTTGTGSKKIKLIDNLMISSSYNFLADSMKLSPIMVSMNTSIFGSLILGAGATFDPYAIDAVGNRINKFNITDKGGMNLARLVNANLSFSYSVSGKGERSGRGGTPDASRNKDSRDHDRNGGHSGSDMGGNKDGSNPINGIEKEHNDYTKVYYHPITGEYIPGGWVYYLDPSVPWSLNFNYNYSYNRSYRYANNQLHTVNNHMQVLSLSGQIRVTKSLNIGINTGFDIVKLAMSSTQLNATYDLHCFQISFSWVPIGQWQSWSFRINAKASALADLLQFKKNSSYWDN